MSAMTMGTSLRPARTSHDRKVSNAVVGRRHSAPVGSGQRGTGQVSPVLAGQGAAESVRLTRRGRALVSIVIALCSGLIGAAAVGWATAGDASATTTHTRTYAVKPGDTLWSIARTINPGADPRETIVVLQQLNPQTRQQLLSGQTISIPQ